MAGDELKLGKGTAFVKSRLKRLRQDEHTREADFRALYPNAFCSCLLETIP